MFSNTRVFVDLIDTTFELELNNMEAKNEIELLYLQMKKIIQWSLSLFQLSLLLI